MNRLNKAITVIATVAIAGASSVLIATAATDTAENVKGIETPAETIQTPPAVTERAREVKVSKEDRVLLERIIMAEAESEDIVGQALVGCVILNRVKSDNFPDTIPEVVFEEGQFTPISNGRFDRVVPNDQVKSAVELVCSGWDESQGATYFKATWDTSTWHDEALHYLFTEGGHKFYREIER